MPSFFLHARKIASAGPLPAILTGLLSISASSGAPMRCPNPHFQLGIDVGHTPQASGATSARGVSEYAFNVKLATRIAETLTSAGFQDVKLIKATGAGYPQLRMRTETANSSKLDLLLSIHHDSVQKSYQENWTYNGQTYAYSDRFSGYSIFVSRLNQRFSDSMAFAKLLGSELQKRNFRYTAHHAELIPGESRELIDSEVGVYAHDNLVVLQRTTAPAVLLEAGIIVNRKDELSLTSPLVQEKIATGVLGAVDAYCMNISQTKH